MNDQETITVNELLHPYDSFQSKSIWKPNEESSCYDYTTDSQCKVPLGDLEKYKEELNLA